MPSRPIRVRAIECECLRCGGTWTVMAAKGKPKACRLCHSTLWDEKRRNERGQGRRKKT